MYTVRALADGEHYFAPRTFESETLAFAYVDSTVSRIRREDPTGLEITVDLHDEGGDVLYSTTLS